MATHVDQVAGVRFLSQRYAGSEPKTEPAIHPKIDPPKGPTHGMLKAHAKA